MDVFYEMKILDVTANQSPRYLKKRFFILSKQMKSLEYQQIDLNNSLFIVDNKEKGTKYTVEIDSRICSCVQDNTGKSSKHQIFVAKSLNINLSLCLPTTEETRKKLHVIATGSSDI